MAPQPPGPGLPEQAPSVKICTVRSLAGSSPVSVETISARSCNAAVETELLPVFQGVFRRDQGTRRMIQPIVEAGQKEAQAGAARQNREGGPFRLRQGPHAFIGSEQCPGLGHV